MSKIAISSEGPGLTDLVDPRFGRVAGFVVYDTETQKHEYVDNGSSQAMSHGAGIQTAETISRLGVETVLTGIVGPKAHQALKAAKVKIGQGCEGLTVQAAIERFMAGQVELI